MELKILDMSDVIIIITKIIEDIQNEKLYGVEIDTLEIPQHINDKLDSLEENVCEELFCTIDEIVQEVYDLKSGELHELNLIHKEIMILANEKLYKYIK